MKKILIILIISVSNAILTSEKKRSLELYTYNQDKKRAKINFLNSYDFHQAIENRDIKTVYAMLRSNTSLANIPYSGKTPLHTAAVYSNPNMIQALLEFGAAIDAKNSYGETALHVASRHGNVLCVKLLIKEKTHIDTASTSGITPLHLAAAHGYFRTVKILLDSKANPDIISDIEISPMLMAAWNGHRKCTQTLLKSDCKIHPADKQMSPIQAAMYKRNYDCASLIREHIISKADPSEMCPICFDDFKETAASITLLDCCLKPICKKCKYELKQKTYSRKYFGGCPNCRNPHF